MLLRCAARGGMLATPPKSPESTAACIPQHTRHTPAKAALVGSHCIPPSRALCQQAHPAPNEPPQPRHRLSPDTKKNCIRPRHGCHALARPAPPRLGRGLCGVCQTPLGGVPGNKDKVEQLQPGCGLRAASRQAGRQRCSRLAVICWPGSKRRGGCPARTRPQRLPSSCAGQEPGGKTSISASSSRAWAAGADTGTGGPCRILKLRQKIAAQRRISEWGGWGGAACTLAAVPLLDW